VTPASPATVSLLAATTGADVVARFEEVDPDGPVQLNTDASARVVQHAFVRGPGGDAVVVWSALTGYGRRLQLAYAPAGGDFGPPQTIREDGYSVNGYPEYVVRAVHGAGGFLLLWQVTTWWGADGGLSGAFLQAGVLGAPVVIQESQVPPGASGVGWHDTILDVVADAYGYTVALGGYYRPLHLRRFDGVRWTEPVLLSDEICDGSLSLATDGTRVLAAFALPVAYGDVPANGSYCSAATSLFTAETGWSPVARLAGTYGRRGAWRPVAAASDGTSFAVATAALEDEGWLPGFWIGDGRQFTREAVPAGFRWTYGNPLLAAIDGAWALAVNSVSFSGPSTYGAVRTAAGWSTAPFPVGASANTEAIATDGAGFAVLLTRPPVAVASATWAEPAELLFSEWRDGAWSAPVPVGAALSTRHRPALVPAAPAAGYDVAWAEDDGELHRVRTVRAAGGAVEAPVDGVIRPSAAGASEVSLAQDGAGGVLAVWTQGHRRASRVMAAYRPPGQPWGQPVLLDANGLTPVVASDGRGFVAAWGATPTSSAETSWTSGDYVRTAAFEGGAWSAPVTLSSAGTGVIGKVQVASDGHGYAVGAFVDGRATAWLRTDGAWGAPQTLGPSDSADRAGFGVSIAGRGGEFLFAWQDYAPEPAPDSYWALTFTHAVIARRGADGVYAWSERQELARFEKFVYGLIRVALFDGGAAVITETEQGALRAAVAPKGSDRFVEREVVPDASGCVADAIVPHGAGLVALARCAGAISALRFDGAAWQPLTEVARFGTTRVPAALAASGSELVAIWEDRGDLWGARWNGTWTAPFPVDPTPTATRVDVYSGPAKTYDLVADERGFHAAWIQQDDADPALDQLWYAPLP
jgi:hypothetical protein